MYICVCGSREFTDYSVLEKALNSIIKTKPCIIVSGTARGADSLGELYALNHDLICIRFPADWQKYGKKAGMIRNKEMAQYSDSFIVFWDCTSKGTKHMLTMIKNTKKPYFLFNVYGDLLYEHPGKLSILDWLA